MQNPLGTEKARCLDKTSKTLQHKTLQPVSYHKTSIKVQNLDPRTLKPDTSKWDSNLLGTRKSYV